MRSEYFSHISDADMADYLPERDEDELTTWRPQSVASSDYADYDAMSIRKIAPDYPSRRPQMVAKDSRSPKRPPSARLFHSAGLPQTPISLDMQSQISHSTKSTLSEDKFVLEQPSSAIRVLRRKVCCLMAITIIAVVVLAAGVTYTLMGAIGGKITAGSDGAVNLNGMVSVQTTGTSASLAVMGTPTAPSASIRIGSQPSGVQSIDFGNYGENGFNPGVTIVAKSDSITLNAAQMILRGELQLGRLNSSNIAAPFINATQLLVQSLLVSSSFVAKSGSFERLGSSSLPIESIDAVKLRASEIYTQSLDLAKLNVSGDIFSPTVVASKICASIISSMSLSTKQCHATTLQSVTGEFTTLKSVAITATSHMTILGQVSATSILVDDRVTMGELSVQNSIMSSSLSAVSISAANIFSSGSANVGSYLSVGGALSASNANIGGGFACGSLTSTGSVRVDGSLSAGSSATFGGSVSLLGTLFAANMALTGPLSAAGFSSSASVTVSSLRSGGITSSSTITTNGFVIPNTLSATAGSGALTVATLTAGIARLGSLSLSGPVTAAQIFAGSIDATQGSVQSLSFTTNSLLAASISAASVQAAALTVATLSSGASTVSSISSTGPITASAMSSSGPITAAGISSSAAISAPALSVSSSVTADALVARVASFGELSSNTLRSDSLTVNTISASTTSSLTISAAVATIGSLSVGELTSATIVSSGGISSNGLLFASGISSAGSVTAHVLYLTSGVVIPYLSCSGGISSGTVSAAGAISGASLSLMSALTSSSLTSSSIFAGSISISGTLMAQSLSVSVPITVNGLYSSGPVTAGHINTLGVLSAGQVQGQLRMTYVGGRTAGNPCLTTGLLDFANDDLFVCVHNNGYPVWKKVTLTL